MNIINSIKRKIKKRTDKPLKDLQSAQANTASHEKHKIPGNLIHSYVFTILRRFNDAGFEAYLVGGCVRDLLLGKEPKDFDIATDAKPEEIKKVFRNCRLIGKRFRLAHIYHKTDTFEVATFRGNHESTSIQNDAGMLLRDNVYGTMEEDAWRRDFTVNALYYTSQKKGITDYTHGLDDLDNKILRIIGDATTRYQEDPVRILRAIRFMSKLDFTLSPETEKPIKALKGLIANVASARLFHELLKIFHGGYASKNFKNLQHYELLSTLLPEVAGLLDRQHENCQKLLTAAFNNTDTRIQEGKSVSPVFLFAFLLWYPMIEHYTSLRKDHMAHHTALDIAMQHAIITQNKIVNIPKRLTISVKEVWRLQFILEKIPKRRVRLHRHSRFRAAYDLLLLRNETDEPLDKQATWWTNFVNKL